MKNALILHGAGNNSQGNWFPWLAGELRSLGYKVWSPDLPNSDEPIQKDWLETIFSNKEWEFNEESTIVGHSAGATLILRILENLPEPIQINKAIMVACPVKVGANPAYAPYKRDLVKTPFNWDKIQKSAKKHIFIYSNNDPYECGSENGDVIREHMQAEFIIKPEEGHFNLEKGPQYKQLPLVLELAQR